MRRACKPCWSAPMAGAPTRASSSARFVKKSKQLRDGDAPASRCGQNCASPPSSNEREKKRVVEITRKMTVGTLERAGGLLQASSGGTVLNTAFIERFNGTMRERLASLTRRCRHAAGRLEALEAGMYLIGCTYNFCWPHHELSKPHHVGQACTPAMASGVVDRVWRVSDLLVYQLVPAPWVEPRRRGRPRTQPLPDPTQPKRPRGRPRKAAL